MAYPPGNIGDPIGSQKQHGVGYLTGFIELFLRFAVFKDSFILFCYENGISMERSSFSLFGGFGGNKNIVVKVLSITQLGELKQTLHELWKRKNYLLVTVAVQFFTI